MHAFLVDKETQAFIERMMGLEHTPSSYRMIREALGWNAKELSEVMEVSRETILRRERGQAAITREAWLALKATFAEAVVGTYGAVVGNNQGAAS